MADYWKSLPRKYCDLCKCWFADNKASNDFHEKGKKHQDNVQKRLRELRKKGLRDFKEKQHYDLTMKKIEQAAFQAYQKDLANSFATSSSAKTSSAKATFHQPDIQSQPAIGPQLPFAMPPPMSNSQISKWVEAHTEEGQPYYWNMETGETSWEAPSEGFMELHSQKMGKATESEVNTNMHISLTEKAASTEETASEDAKENLEEKGKGEVSGEESSEKVAEPSPIGPLPRHNPYGEWVAVPRKEEVKTIDLQLPKTEDDYEEIVSIPVEPEEPPKMLIKERTLKSGALLDGDDEDSLSNQGFFKKRKFGSTAKRNVRQRTDDD